MDYKELWERPDKEFWTIDELAEALQRSPNSFKKHFKHQQEMLKEQGIVITKYGRGINARYTVDFGYEK